MAGCWMAAASTGTGTLKLTGEWRGSVDFFERVSVVDSRGAASELTESCREGAWSIESC